MFTSVPPSVALHAWPEAVTAQIPMLQPYRYATLGKLLLIVNPDDRKIVDIISPWKMRRRAPVAAIPLPELSRRPWRRPPRTARDLNPRWEDAAW